MQYLEDTFGPSDPQDGRPEMELHHAIAAERETWNFVLDRLRTCEAAELAGKRWPAIAASDLASYRQAVGRLREFHTYYKTSVDQLDARDELIALATDEAAYDAVCPATERERVELFRELRRRAFPATSPFGGSSNEPPTSSSVEIPVVADAVEARPSEPLSQPQRASQAEDASGPMSGFRVYKGSFTH